MQFICKITKKNNFNTLNFKKKSLFISDKVINHFKSKFIFLPLFENVQYMSPITLIINEKTKAGKALKALIDVLAGSNDKTVEIVKDKTIYNKNFVKKVVDSYNNDSRVRIKSKDLWESI